VGGGGGGVGERDAEAEKEPCAATSAGMWVDGIVEEVMEVGLFVAPPLCNSCAGDPAGTCLLEETLLAGLCVGGGGGAFDNEKDIL